MLTTRSVQPKLPGKKKSKRTKKLRKLEPVKSKHEKISSDKHILDLPNEILNIVFSNLDLGDRAVLALTCKGFGMRLEYNGLLNWEKFSIASRWCVGRNNILHFTKTRLGKQFFPSELKYCMRCGKYVPRCVTYWEEKLSAEFENTRGELGCKFATWNEVVREHQGYSGDDTYLDWKLKTWSAGNRGESCPRCTFLSSS
jgi:F-box domain